MALSERDNWFRTVLRTGPEWMPHNVYVSRASWAKFGREIEAVVLRHPLTFPNYRQGDFERELGRPWPVKEDPTRDYTDQWGAVWRTTQYGYVGTIVKHPLATDAALANFKPPPTQTYNGGQDPVDFAEQTKRRARDKTQGVRARGWLDHGYFLLRLEYLRGFQNLMCDLADPSADFLRLVQVVHDLNKAAVRNWIAAGAETIGLPEDLGGQQRSILGPKHFRKWGTPYYKELHSTAQAAGCLTHFHCDGNVMDIADQIVEIGPNVFNPQDRANGVDNLARALKGRMCIDLDFDRQHTLPFGTPREIEQLIEYEVRTLGAREGGLMFTVEIRGDVPPRNLDAVATALEKHGRYWFQ